MTWDFETEVLVIGFGGGGAVAALTAHDSGAKVLIVDEKWKRAGETPISPSGDSSASRS